MRLIDVSAGPFALVARLEEQLAPKTSAAFLKMLPYQDKLIHVRWSGEGCWIPLGDSHMDLPWENHSSFPQPGQFILYPGGVSEAEILLPYGEVCFSSRYGQLPGNRFLTVVEGKEFLPALGERTLWQGAQDIRFSPR